MSGQARWAIMGEHLRHHLTRTSLDCCLERTQVVSLVLTRICLLLAVRKVRILSVKPISAGSAQTEVALKRPIESERYWPNSGGEERSLVGTTD